MPADNEWGNGRYWMRIIFGIAIAVVVFAIVGESSAALSWEDLA
jgi:hypothetical protein